jgi:Spy/CpxP family protein refolding chaperone
MAVFTKTKILTAVIIVLLATNISTFYTVWKLSDNTILAPNTAKSKKAFNPNIPMGRLLSRELQLTPEQMSKFREFRKDYYPYVHMIYDSLHLKRHEMLKELAKENPDTVILLSISKDIGIMHADLKMATNNFYLNMKNVCTPEQQEKLNNIFEAMLNSRNKHNCGKRISKHKHFR